MERGSGRRRKVNVSDMGGEKPGRKR